jgi:3-oxoacyl-[acyl-carrier protein] reductase
MPWGADPGGVEALLGALPGDAETLHWVPEDLEDPDAADRLVSLAHERFGGLDAVVANHARSSVQGLFDCSVAELDRCWAVNARASLLLARALAQRRDAARSGGRVVLFTSAQHLSPMAPEIPYAVTKGAIQQMTATLADALADRTITVNCVNPGPVDTGYAKGDSHRRIAGLFPAGRWGQPEDVARLVAWLVSDEAAWITGQVINSEGGFRRFGAQRIDPGDR